MTARRQRMLKGLQLRGVSARTQARDVRAVRRLAEPAPKSPDVSTAGPHVRNPRDTACTTQAQHALPTWLMPPQALWRCATRAGATGQVPRPQIVALVGSHSLRTGGSRASRTATPARLHGASALPWAHACSVCSTVAITPRLEQPLPHPHAVVHTPRSSPPLRSTRLGWRPCATRMRHTVGHPVLGYYYSPYGYNPCCSHRTHRANSGFP